MFNRKKDSSPKIDSAVGKAANFEVTIADVARRSERRAWIVAWCAIAMSLILASGYFFLLPLKERVPYLVMADAFTGTSTVARLRDDFRNAEVTRSEAINRSNVAHFILARESYDIALQSLRDWTTVYTMASPEVASAYTTLHARNNPSAPYNLYGGGRSVRVKILSIVFIEDGQGMPTGATVRFQRSLFDKASGATRPLDSKIATMAFTYKNNLQMDEKHRIENPLGFQVTSYRVDNDYAAVPPLADEAPLAPPMPALMPPTSTGPDGLASPAASVSSGAPVDAGGAPLTGAEQANAQATAATRSQPASAQDNANGVGAR